MVVSVYCTASSLDEARKLARHVLERRLAACANVWPIESQYWWEGRLEQAQEAALLLKTQPSLVEPLVAAVRAVHSDRVPCVVAWPVQGGNPEYLAWIARETEQKA
jgi:periplasmic divalent cation tolerance protein